MDRLTLTEEEVRAMNALVAKVVSQFSSAEDERLLACISLFAHALPWRVRKHLNDFRLLESGQGVALISGCPVDDRELGPTPQCWSPDPGVSSGHKEEILLIPGVGPQMAEEFEEYRPYDSIERFRREIGKYVDSTEVARLEQYVTIR